MKKISLIIFFFAVSLSSFSQHMKFMGIPIDGTISEFQSKIATKGFKYSNASAKLPVGVRGYTGKFAEELVTLIVNYNTVSKVVYQVSVVFNDTKFESAISKELDNIYYVMGEKYPDVSYEEDRIPSTYYHLYRRVYNFEDGNAMFITAQPAEEGYYKLQIIYIDGINDKLNKKTESDDL